MTNLEKIPLLEVYRQNGTTHINMSDDANEYEILGALRTFIIAMEEDMINNWKPKP